MFIKDGLRFNIYQTYTDPVTGEHGIDMTRPENRARFNVTEIPDPARGDDEIEYTQEIDAAPYIIITPKSAEQIAAIQAAKAQRAADIAAVEDAKADNVTKYLVAHTPLEIYQYVRTTVNAHNSTNLAELKTAVVELQNLVGKLAAAVGADIRSRLR
jgi:hypothetical protein